MRPVANPPNPYLSAHCELLEPAGAAKLTVYEEDARSILSENDSPDIPFRWSCNPYRGCQHACAYCYARPTHEYLGFGAGTDFDTRIVVKTNAAELLAAQLAKKSWQREFIAFSGVTDCYQPLEAVYQLTRRCLEACLRAGNSCGIVTKAYLVIRDIDVLQELQRRVGVRVYMSIPFADDRRARLIEVGAPPPSRRFAALEKLRDAGIPTGVMVAPLIPGLNDRDIATILRRAAECGAMTAGYVPLRLPGSVSDVFLTRMGQALPEAVGRVEALVREMRGGALNESRFGARMRGTGEYWESIKRLFEMMATRYGLDSGQRWKAKMVDDVPPPTGPQQMSLFDEK